MARTKVDASEVPERLRHPLFDIKGGYFFQTFGEERIPPVWYGVAELNKGNVVARTAHGDGVAAWYGPESDTGKVFPDAKAALVNVAIVLENEANRLESKAEELTEELRQYERVCDVIGEGGEKLYSAPFGQHKSEYIPEHLGPHWWSCPHWRGRPGFLRRTRRRHE